MIFPELDLPDACAWHAGLVRDRTDEVPGGDAVALARVHEESRALRRFRCCRSDRGALSRALALEKPECGACYFRPVVLHEQRFDRQELASRDSALQRTTQLVAQLLLARSRARSRARERVWSEHSSAAERTKCGLLSRCDESDDTGSALDQIREHTRAFRQLEEHHDRSAGHRFAAREYQRRVGGAIAERCDERCDGARSLVRTRIHCRARRIDIVEEATERGRSTLRGHDHVAGVDRDLLELLQLRRGYPPRAPCVALHELLDLGRGARRDDGSRGIPRDLARDRLQRFGLSTLDDLIRPRDHERCHRIQLHARALDELEDFAGRTGQRDWRAGAEEPRGAACGGDGEDRDRGVFRRPRRCGRHRDGDLGVGREDQELDSGCIGLYASQRWLEESRDGCRVVRDLVQHVLISAHSGTFTVAGRYSPLLHPILRCQLARHAPRD